MKKNILFYGLITGLIVTAMMVVTTIMCYQNPNFEDSTIIGLGVMIAAFSFVYIGIKDFRDKENGGFITFGRAFQIGLYITLIASTMYVAVWLIEYYLFMPDFMDKYAAHALNKAKAAGADKMEIFEKSVDMANMKEMYNNPLLVILITYCEILPVGLIITLISGLILKKERKIA